MGEQETLIDKVKQFLNNAQVQAVLRGLFGASGVIYVQLAKLGASPEQIGLVHELFIQFAPMLIVGALSLVQKTHTAIITKAAEILAARQAGAIVIDMNKASEAVTKLARGEKSPDNIIPKTGIEDVDAIAKVNAMPGVEIIVDTNKASREARVAAADPALKSVNAI